MDLPQELLDEIIGHLPTHNDSIRNCSLVARSWKRPSQSRLFADVYIRDWDGSIRSWLDNISPTNIELLGHVRSISCGASMVNLQGVIVQVSPFDILRDYVPSFRQLRSLGLVGPTTFLPQQIQIFSAFQNTLLEFTLKGCYVTTRVLVSLVNYFPNLTHLGLNDLSYHVDDEPIPPLSRPLLGKLSITEFGTEHLGLLDKLSELGLQFDEVAVRVRGDIVGWAEFVMRVTNTFGASAKCLRLHGIYECEAAISLTVSHCRELREFEILMSYPTTAEPNLVSSITSTSIQKITFAQPLTVEVFPVGHSYWKQLDDSLCQLVDRSCRKLRLEVEFLVRGKQDGELDFQGFLPRFLEKGRVRVVDFRERADLLF